MRLVEKPAIVTGGGTGIGAAIARLFAREGARVTIPGRRKEPLDRMVKAIAEAGGQALAAPGSVTDEAAVRRAVAAPSTRSGESTCSSTTQGASCPLGRSTRRPTRSGTRQWRCS